MAVKLKQNIRLWSGNDMDVQFSITDENSSALLLTATTIKWKMALDPYSSAALISKSSTASSELEITDAAGGIVTIKLNSTDTNSISPGVYYHELEVTDSEANPFTVAIGHLTLEKSLI